MRPHVVLLAAGLLYCLQTLSAATVISVPDEDDDVNTDVDSDAEIRLFYGGVAKRGCVSRGGNCDHSPNDCCPSTSCRCNLWGANCRCQRKGVFQNWG
ncbi:putative neurotoxin [Macrosteles quadrilineatus]|uniref:putative neurotoxin n=1 Tax=Macrosteles quadrilineatus TaxID=74068 RepID=UPI0023E15129|nr:putative neurotoxin [Macrosteles quadrilineatus]XP_054266843.1 putative neurotoxin [Macrosteles quadrilineatus]